MHAAILLSLVAAFGDGFFVQGVKMSIGGIRRSGEDAVHAVLSRRSGTVDLMNSGDLEYYMNVTLGGGEFRVMVDSRSADLWVAGAVPESDSTRHSASIQYENGSVVGRVKTATLQIDEMTIENQAYIEHEVDSAHPEGQGILGLGPAGLSSVLAVLSSPEGDSVMNRMLKQGSPNGNFVTTILGRSEDGSGLIPGQFTIGEILSEHQNIQTMPKLEVQRNDWDEHWLVLLDDGGIIGPDGKVVKAPESKQLTVIFDSGYTMSQVPEAVAHAIYSRVPDAKYTTIPASPDPVWVLPCSVELNVTFKFGNISYPIHPLDTVMDDVSGPLDDTGKPSCIGSFRPMGSNSSYDLLLGLAFMRSAYVLQNFGDSATNTARTGEPFFQLLPVVDPKQAHQEFVQRRLNGVDTTGSFKLLPAADDIRMSSALKNYMPAIIAGSIVVGLLPIGAIVGVVFYRRRKYQHLHDPAPEGIAEHSTLVLKPKRWSPKKFQTSLNHPKPILNPYDQIKVILEAKRRAGELVPYNHRSLRTRSSFAGHQTTAATTSEIASRLHGAVPPAINTSLDSTAPPFPPPSPAFFQGRRPLPSAVVDESLPHPYPEPSGEGAAEKSAEDDLLPNPYDEPMLTQASAADPGPLPAPIAPRQVARRMSRPLPTPPMKGTS